MKKLTQKTISLFLSLLMLFMVYPTAAWADNAESDAASDPSDSQEQDSDSGDSQDEYIEGYTTSEGGYEPAPVSEDSDTLPVHTKVSNQATLADASTGVEFHLMTSLDDFIYGAHYVIIPVGKNEALTVDSTSPKYKWEYIEDRGLVKTETTVGVEAKGTTLEGFTADSRPEKIYIKQEDIDAGSYVLSCASQGTLMCSSDGAAYGRDGVKWSSRVKDSTNSKNFIFKLGTDRYNPNVMFDTGGGSLSIYPYSYEISEDEDWVNVTVPGAYTIIHENQTLCYQDKSPTTERLQHCQGFYYGYDKDDYDIGFVGISASVTPDDGIRGFYIYTDAKKVEQETGEEKTYIRMEDLAKNGVYPNIAIDSLFTFTDTTTQKTWALTAPDPKEVEPQTGEKLLGQKNNQGQYEDVFGSATYVQADKGYAWSLTYDYSYLDKEPTTVDNADGTITVTQRFKVAMKQGEQYLWLSQSGLFKKDSTYIYMEIVQTGYRTAPAPSSAVVYFHGGDENSSDRYLGWDSEKQQFTTCNTKENAVAFTRNQERVLNSYYQTEQYKKLTDLSKLKDYDSFVLVYTDPDNKNAKYAITDWFALYDTTYYKTTNDSYGIPLSDDDGSNYIGTSACRLVQVEQSTQDYETISALTAAEISLGDVVNSNEKNGWIDFQSARFKSGAGGNFYLGGKFSCPLDENSATLVPRVISTTEDKKIRIAYNKDKSAFNIRGNSGNQWLSVAESYYITNMYDEDGSYLYETEGWVPHFEKIGYAAAVVQSQTEAADFEIYVKITDNYYNVVFHDTDGNATSESKHDKNLTLPQKDDIESAGTTYAFVGWSTDSKYKGHAFLSLDDSCNLFDYGYYDETSNTSIGHIMQEAAEKYSLLGPCNPEGVNTVDISKVALADDNKIHLYPIYAVRGYSTVAAVKDTEQKAIVGVSDWKPIQAGDHSYDSNREQWLGKINVEVYKDGERWGAEPVYFRYHNDDSADLNIKFIWDNLVNDAEGENAEEKLYSFVSDTTQFPEYDQTGHFVIDGVYAEQGGSEDGLYYSLNWMTDHGGQLDNVKGGSTVKIYVTTKYNVAYYLDDQLITDSAWTNTNYYTTKGTDEKFKADTATAKYEVSVSKLNELMNRDTTEYDESKVFVNDDMKRGDYSGFAYVIYDYEHTIPIAASPASLVASGRTLTSTDWQIKDSNMTVVGNTAWSSNYDILGTSYGTGNTMYAYRNSNQAGLPEAKAAYTYHLYAYTTAGTDVPTPTPATTPTATPTANPAATPTATPTANPTAAPSATPSAVIPRTGDDSNVSLWIFLCVASAAAFAGAVVAKKKRK